MKYTSGESWLASILVGRDPVEKRLAKIKRGIELADEHSDVHGKAFLTVFLCRYLLDVTGADRSVIVEYLKGAEIDSGEYRSRIPRDFAQVAFLIGEFELALEFLSMGYSFDPAELMSVGDADELKVRIVKMIEVSLSLSDDAVKRSLGVLLGFVVNGVRIDLRPLAEHRSRLLALANEMDEALLLVPSIEQSL